MVELAALIFAAFHKERPISLKADKSALIEAKTKTFLYVEMLHAQMLLAKYTEPCAAVTLGKRVASQPHWPPEPVKHCKSVLIETLKPAGLSHMNLCKHLTVQASGRNNRVHSQCWKTESPKTCWLGWFHTEMLFSVKEEHGTGWFCLSSRDR